jgi:glycine/D-amino acid oxidase-like deaminating enzyme
MRSSACVALRRGVELHEGEQVQSWSADGASVRVHTDQGDYSAARLVFTAGAWTAPLLADLGLPLEVRRKVVWWFDVDKPRDFTLDRFPIFISEGPAGMVYGFPIYGVPGMKAANHAGGDVTTADTVNRTASDGETGSVIEFAHHALPSVTSRTLDHAVCMYTMTPDRDFIVDRHPEYPNVALAAGFSGHGFKFAPVIGEMLADMATDPNARPIPRFALGRFVGS